MPSPQVSLYARWYSDCSARLRLALQLKDINYDYIAVDDQNTETYKALNPSGAIPTLVVQEADQIASKPTIIWQSLAALEYLEERYPQKQLLPPAENARQRAAVRCLMNIIAADLHPLTTAKVRRRIYEQFPCPATEQAAATGNYEWDKFWIQRGLSSYERVVKDNNGTYSVGDNITLADVCLLPSVWTAQRYGVPLDEFPTICRIVMRLHCVGAVQRAHWRFQPDTPEEHRIDKLV